MQELVDSYKKSGIMHHAYFLVGDTNIISEKLINFLENNVGVKTKSNPDFFKAEFKTLTIENARWIGELQERKSFGSSASSTRKIFVIQTDFITTESQNALLKVIEEPTENTHFFIICPQNNLLPTLRSRMQVILSTLSANKSEGILTLKIKERLAKVKDITDAISDEEKSKQDAINLLNNIEMELYENGLEKSAESLKICEQTRGSLYDRGAPIKMILENLMLSI